MASVDSELSQTIYGHIVILKRHFLVPFSVFNTLTVAKTDGTENDKNRDRSIIAATISQYFSCSTGGGNVTLQSKFYWIDLYAQCSVFKLRRFFHLHTLKACHGELQFKI
ncbi:hypothetical protein D5E81_09470 [Vibrio parahaemolyticus]|nr:hypothetical protein D5E81_09470 [Vibrio parahaemolyticus]